MLDNSPKLSGMSNEDLWALFPIVIREYNADYPIWYAEEEFVLAELIGNKKLFAGICNASVFLGIHGFLNEMNHTGNGLEYLKEYAGTGSAVNATISTNQQ